MRLIENKQLFLKNINRKLERKPINQIALIYKNKKILK